ncbi:hypothetical protein HPP92_014710 [Vanilla planifolia]|uniref:Uncharacterized protein n=1 Tax=Vanilla planifolia TaxID=51239 RepID=A0A835USZ7_VANPL|nr:hypothetical protein HPP92_014710 [Vanilla planifolia]
MIRVAMAGSMQHVNSLPKVLMMYGLLRGYLKKGVLGRSCRIISFNDDGDGRDIFATLKSGPGKFGPLIPRKGHKFEARKLRYIYLYTKKLVPVEAFSGPLDDMLIDSPLHCVVHLLTHRVSVRRKRLAA